MAKDKEQDKQKVLAAAQEAFLRLGRETTLEEIAKQGKIDAKQVKSAYSSIDAVLDDLIAKDIEENSELFTRIINDRGKADIKLTRLVRELLTRYQKSYPLYHIIGSGLGDSNSDEHALKGRLKPEHLDRFRQNTAIIGRLIAQGQSENIFTDVDPLEAAYLLRGMIGAAIGFRRTTQKEDDMRDHADIIMRVFLKGLLR